MKKIYCKPKAIVEIFQVNEYIAGSCGDKILVPFAIDACSVELGDDIFFSQFCQDIGGINVVDPGNGGNICYQGPVNESNFFSS